MAGGSGKLGDKGSRTAMIFNPANNLSSPITQMPSAIESATCAFFKNKVYVGDEGSGEISVFNLATKLWEATIPLSQQSLLSIFTIKTGIYVIVYDRSRREKLVYDLHDHSPHKIIDIKGKLHHLLLYKDLLDCN